MKRLINFLVVIVSIVIGLVFALLNAEPVPFNYFIARAQIPLSLIMIVTFVCGALVGVIASVTVILRIKRDLLKERKNVRRKEKEFNTLKALPLKEQQ